MTSRYKQGTHHRTPQKLRIAAVCWVGAFYGIELYQCVLYHSLNLLPRCRSGLLLRHNSRSTNLLTPLCNSKNEQGLKCNKNFRGSFSWYKLVILKFSTENDNFLVASLPLKGALFLGKITPLLRCLLHPQLMKAPVFTKKATILDWESNPGPLGSTPGHKIQARSAYVSKFIRFGQTAGGGAAVVSQPLGACFLSSPRG